MDINLISIVKDEFKKYNLKTRNKTFEYSENNNSITFDFEIYNSELLYEISKKIYNSQIFNYVDYVFLIIEPTFKINKSTKEIIQYSDKHKKYYIRLDKDNKNNLKKMEELNKLISYISKIKKSCVINGCPNDSQDSHSISKCFLKKIAEKDIVYSISLIDYFFSVEKITQNFISNKDYIQKKNIKNVSITKSFCHNHDSIFTTAFENLIIFENNEYNCRLLYYRTLNTIFVMNEIINESASNSGITIQENIKNRINLYKQKNKINQKKLNEIGDTISLLIDLKNTNIMYSGVFSSYDLITIYAYLQNTKIESFVKENDINTISINIFADNNSSKLIITTEKSDFMKKFMEHIREIFEKTSELDLINYFLFLGFMTTNICFNPNWYNNLNTENKNLLNKMSEYLIFGMIKGENPTKYLNKLFRYDFNDIYPFEILRMDYINK